MEILNAMDLIGRINRKRNPIQALSTHHTSEALWMIRLASGPQNPLQNRLKANRTFLQRIQIIILTIWLPIQRVKRFSLQIYLALLACEATDVIHLIHCCAAGSLSDDPAIALDTDAITITVRIGLVHRLDQEVGQGIHLRLLIDDW